MTTIEADNEINYTSPLKLEASDAFINLSKIYAMIIKKKCQILTFFYSSYDFYRKIYFVFLR